MGDIDMRVFASKAGSNVTSSAGSTVFAKGDRGTCMDVVQSGTIEIVIGDRVVEVCEPNEAIGFMSVIRRIAAHLDGPRERGRRIIHYRRTHISLHRRRNSQLALYVMEVMAPRIRGISAAI